MKRKKWRYTEYAINSEPRNGLGWLKLILIYVVVSPLRLINEISQKVIFLGSAVLRRICVYAVLFNVGFIVWDIFWSFVSNNSRPFLPFPMMIVSTGLTVLIYIYLGGTRDFDYEIIRGVDEKEVERALAVDLDEIVAFERTSAADVSFEDSINIFIKDPGELTALGIEPALYDEAEDARLLRAIEQKTDIFPIERITLPDFMEEPPLGSQLEDNFNSLMDELEQQLKSA